jgi:hypothetical protein
VNAGEVHRFDVYGLELEVRWDGERWRAYRLGEGKCRELHDLVIPPDLREAELERFLADVCHEMATPKRREVRRIAVAGTPSAGSVPALQYPLRASRRPPR